MHEHSRTESRDSSVISWRLCAVVLVDALLAAAGAVIALVRPEMLVGPHDAINGAVHIYAGYLASRNLAIAVLLVALLWMRATHALSNLMVLVAFIQILDAIIDCTEGRWIIVPGVLLIGLIFLFSAARLSGYPFWKFAAWSQGR